MTMNQLITIVSGLPRSGTSLMMKMLEAGKMEVVTDNIRKADVDNPKGYYEFERVKKIKEDSSWLNDTRGKVFKMISLLLLDLPPTENYKIIFMRRHMDEVIASQTKMLKRLDQKPGADDDKMKAYFSKHLDRVYAWLEQQENIDTLFVSYNDILSNPETNAEKINQFLENPLDVEKMAQVVDTSLYRNRG